MRDIERKVVAGPIQKVQEQTRVTRLLEIARRIHAQQRHDTGKVYSVHAPEVECIAPDGLKVWIAGAKRGVTVAIKKKLKRRNAVEPVIGHMKADGRLGRNFLKGTQGDAMNALLCGAGHNLRKILRRLALLCAQILECLQPPDRIKLQTAIN